MSIFVSVVYYQFDSLVQCGFILYVDNMSLCLESCFRPAVI